MIGSTIIHLDSVDSTNNYAATELLTKSLNEGTVVAAGCQNAGRGQWRAKWESAPGLNLTFSVVLYPDWLDLSRQFLLSQTISLGMADYLSQSIQGVSVKWPNDIYVNDKKIAGILIETAIMGDRFSHAIVGVGLNVNQEVFVSDAPNPVSMKILTDECYDLDSTLNDLCQKLDLRYRQLVGSEYETLQYDYQKLLYKRGIWANFRAQEEDFEGRISGVESDGRVLIETRDGEERGFYFKEVVYR